MARERLGEKVERRLEAPKEAVDKGDTANTSTQRLTNASESQQIAGTTEILRSISSTMILANIFGERIMPELANNAPNAMRDTAMDIYFKSILAPNGYESLLQLQDAIKSAGNTEVRYNLLRVYERFVEVREVMEREIIPIWTKYSQVINTGDRKAIMEYQKLVSGMLPKANPLTREIVNRVLMLP